MFTEQNQAASEDPLLLFDEDWIFRTALSTVLIEEASNRVLNYQPVPTRFQSYHASFRDAAQLMSESMVGYRTALDNFDVDGIIAASERMNEATAIIAELTERAEAGELD